ncbi:putative methyltransferase [Calothrix sp. PCC 7716]|nr:putative methyltransferase [Calothrix sp. PCC 7716]
MRTIINKAISKLHRLQLNERVSTSLSDNQIYPNFCLQASNDYRIFQNFRSNSIYTEILEHVTYKQGNDYLQQIQKSPQILAEIDKFRDNDKVGNPRVFTYDSVGKFSPSTLRYIKVLSDLEDIFRNLNSLNICEIGVGYGGQCRVINSYYKPNTYTLVDIKPALMLAQRFLDNFIIESKLIYQTMNELDKFSKYDLLISNYAFTELPRVIQDVYLEKIILNSQRGYITYNEITPVNFNSYKKSELLDIIPNAKVMEEVPLTYPNNCIIFWDIN